MRKTNLFYLDGNDSKFLTFSNYSEYLTGVYLSTNHKMYLSTFLCFNLPFSANYTVKGLKKYLTQHYENKLAVLKDKIEEKNELSENNIHPLAYLLETIGTYFKKTPKIVYYGDITEHDYNGTYADSICLVDLDKFYEGTIIIDNNKNFNDSYFIDKEDILLHGWTEQELNIYHTSYSSFSDSKDNYENDTPLINIEINKLENSSLEFNCVIPLFNVIDVNKNKYNNITSDIDNEAESNIINLRNTDYKYENIPYGIWFSGHDPEEPTSTTTEEPTSTTTEEPTEIITNIPTDETTTTTTQEKPEYYIIPIILHKDSNNISQSWSLVIASKFSPYPFGINAQSEFNDNKETRLEKYTYAELLERHSKLLDEYSKLINKYSTIEEKINELSNKVNSQIGQMSADNLITKFNNLEQNIKNTINNKIQEIDEKLSILKWKNINNA